ncbi:echinoderm microtubule-associated protein-like elp-1 [Anaeramoeba flamelloides]|uniref:Echinoderm microtubule-associated protein-like elp-1 n=1 Tax=Anaeramoeba flamelloides TaxID=1746091 RepID=A0AAV7Z0C0_9EUKA|nr:echinoderm microtubule-associated protein-like elp-1 [Anaeramoeba flamelloides]|eukprot:Anaeramoba_flamelloidesa1059457_40.p1 GENE.a1059457_40~~a1059457_40.p1  ORF type:complete len:792 (-),score=170.82 a1059457_40:23-2398(-)
MDTKRYREKLDNETTKYKVWLFVTIIQAKDLPIFDTDEETTDPYCVLKIGEQTYKSKVMMRNTNPKFGEIYRFGLVDYDQKLKIHFYHFEDFVNDPLIGTTKIKLDIFEKNKTLCDWFPLKTKKKEEKAQIELKFTIQEAPEQRYSLQKPELLQNKPLKDALKDPLYGVILSPLPKDLLKQVQLLNLQNNNENDNHNTNEMEIEKESSSIIDKISQNTNQMKVVTEGIHLELEHIYGYRGWEGRNNIKWISDTEIVYFAASVGIVLNIETNIQRFFIGHTETITCIALHPEGDIVATGQLGNQSKIRVWKLSDCSEILNYQVDHPKGVINLCFTPDGKKLLTIGSDNDHTMNLYDLETNKMVLTQKGHSNKSLCATFDDNNRTRLVICGIRHLCFGELIDNKLKLEEVAFAKKGNQMFLSTIFNKNGDLLASTSKGELLVIDYENQIVKKTYRLHAGPCVTLTNSKQGYLTTGGKDGKIKIINGSTYEVEHTITNIVAGPIRSVHYRNGKVIIGTNKNEIYASDIKEDKSYCVLMSHAEEVFGLTCDPTTNTFSTGSDDRSVRAWDIMNKKFLRRKPVNGQPRCVTYSNNGGFLGIGLRDGEFLILQANNFSQIANKKEIVFGAEIMNFSPDSKYLCLLDSSGTVHIYNSSVGFKRFQILDKIAKGATAIDWSSDSSFIRIALENSILYLEIATAKTFQECPSSELSWESNKVEFATKITDSVSTIDVHPNSCFVTGHSKGILKLFTNFESEPQIYQGHSGQIEGIKFYKDSHVISIGGSDKCIFQWKMVY